MAAVDSKPESEPGHFVANMKPAADSKASGSISYAELPSGVPLVSIRLRNLEPVSGETQYVIWQVKSRHDMVSIATYTVKGDGRISENLKLNPGLLVALENEGKDRMLVTKIPDDDRFRESFAETQDPWDPVMTGEPILEGSLRSSPAAE